MARADRNRVARSHRLLTGRARGRRPDVREGHRRRPCRRPAAVRYILGRGLRRRGGSGRQPRRPHEPARPFARQGTAGDLKKAMLASSAPKRVSPEAAAALTAGAYFREWLQVGLLDGRGGDRRPSTPGPETAPAAAPARWCDPRVTPDADASSTLVRVGMCSTPPSRVAQACSA